VDLRQLLSAAESDWHQIWIGLRRQIQCLTPGS
jgi:hypothetical protein